MRNFEEKLRTAKVTAETANNAKSAFLANISHEIRTPLNGVMGMLQLVLLSELDQQQYLDLECAINSCETLLSIINDILDFAKIEAGKAEIEEAPFNLSRLLKTTMMIFAKQANERGVSLTWSVDESVPSVLCGDSKRLRQILFNLVGNAMKFTESGTVSIKFSLEEQQNNSGDQFLIGEVKDTGAGMSEKLLKSIFEPFSKGDDAITSPFKGSGLGLSIVKGLVELLGGNISVDSTPGQGTRVTFSARTKFARRKDLPIWKSSKKLTGNTVSPAEQKQLKILLAEDNDVNRLLAQRFLETLGHSVFCVSNGREVLAILGEQIFDAILMDIQMPELDGMETTKVIRAHVDRELAVIPIIAMTAHAMKGDREDFIRAGMNDYIAKPVRIQDLNQILKRTFCSNDCV